MQTRKNTSKTRKGDSKLKENLIRTWAFIYLVASAVAKKIANIDVKGIGNSMKRLHWKRVFGTLAIVTMGVMGIIIVKHFPDAIAEPVLSNANITTASLGEPFGVEEYHNYLESKKYEQEFKELLAECQRVNIAERYSAGTYVTLGVTNNDGSEHRYGMLAGRRSWLNRTIRVYEQTESGICGDFIGEFTFVDVLYNPDGSEYDGYDIKFWAHDVTEAQAFEDAHFKHGHGVYAYFDPADAERLHLSEQQ